MASVFSVHNFPVFFSFNCWSYKVRGKDRGISQFSFDFRQLISDLTAKFLVLADLKIGKFHEKQCYDFGNNGFDPLGFRDKTIVPCVKLKF